MSRNAGAAEQVWDCWPWFAVHKQKGSGAMAFYVKMSSAPGECAREAMRQGLGVSAAVAIGYAISNHDHRKSASLTL